MRQPVRARPARHRLLLSTTAAETGAASPAPRGGDGGGEGLGRKLLRGAAWGQAGQLVAFAMGIILQIVLARGLGADQYGLFSALNGAVYLGIAIASAGASGTLNTHLTRLAHEYGRPAAAYLFWRVWMWRLVIFAAAGLSIALFADPLGSAFLGEAGHGPLMAAGVLYLFAVGMFQIANMLFYGLLETKWAAIGQMMSAVTNVSVSTVLIVSGASLTEIVLGLAIGQLAICGLQLARGWHRLRPSFAVAGTPPAARTDISGLWRFSLTVWGIGLLTQALGKQTDLFMMQLYRVDLAEIGFYNLAVTLAIMANAIFLMGIGQVALAGLSSLRAKHPEKIGQGWRTLCSVCPLISVPILTFVGVFADPIVSALYGDEYSDAALMLQVFVAFQIVGQMLGGGAHQTAFTAMGIPRLTLRARLVTGVANLAVNAALIPVWGAMGAVIGTGVFGVLTVLYEYSLMRRQIPERLPWRTLGRAGIALVPGLVPAYFIAPHLGILGVLVGGAIYMGCYLAMTLAIRPIVVDPDVATALPRAACRLIRVAPESGISHEP